MDGSLVYTLTRKVEKEMAESLKELGPEEAAVMALLQQQLKNEAGTSPRSRRARRAKKAPAQAKTTNLRKQLEKSLEKLRAAG